MSSLECSIYYDSTQHPAPQPACGERLDLHADPDAGHSLIQLGLSPRHDLPVLLLSEPGGKLRLVGFRLAPDEVERLASGRGISAERLRVYSSAWCPDCRRAKRVLAEAAAHFEEVDIDRDAHAEALVLERSGGRRVVPTLSFGDRLWAFNPDPPLLRRLLPGPAGAIKEMPA
jgi:mycoredoxin